MHLKKYIVIKIDKSYVYKSVVDIDAHILPGIGIGNIKLDTQLFELKNWILYNSFIKNNDSLVVTAFNGIFLLYDCNNVIQFIVNAVESKIVRVSCMKGYRGFYKEAIRPGNTFFELLKVESDFEINNGVLVSKNSPGLEIDLPDEFEDIDYVNELPDFVLEKVSCCIPGSP